jgi:hypothetical protein
MPALGPVQLVAVAFGPGASFEGRVLAELSKLEERATIRLLDLLIVGKDPDSGELVPFDLELGGEGYGAVVEALLGLDLDGGEPAPQAGRLSHADVVGLGAAIPPGHAGAFLLVEHVWARDLKAAIGEAGGVPLGEGFLAEEVLAAVAAELASIAEAR